MSGHGDSPVPGGTIPDGTTQSPGGPRSTVPSAAVVTKILGDLFNAPDGSALIRTYLSNSVKAHIIQIIS
jgi:hypothetical protein